jgi:hypothetical protein
LRVVQVSLAFDNLIGVGELKDLPHSAPRPRANLHPITRSVFTRQSAQLGLRKSALGRTRRLVRGRLNVRRRRERVIGRGGGIEIAVSSRPDRRRFSRTDPPGPAGRTSAHLARRQPARCRWSAEQQCQWALGAATSCSRAKRLTSAISVVTSRSTLPISASTRAMTSFATAAACVVGAVSEMDTVLITSTRVSFSPAGLRSTSRGDSRWTSTSTASTAAKSGADAHRRGLYRPAQPRTPIRCPDHHQCRAWPGFLSGRGLSSGFPNPQSAISVHRHQRFAQDREFEASVPRSLSRDPGVGGGDPAGLIVGVRLPPLFAGCFTLQLQTDQRCAVGGSRAHTPGGSHVRSRRVRRSRMRSGSAAQASAGRKCRQLHDAERRLYH